MCPSQATQQLFRLGKVIMLWTFAVPQFLLATTRLIKLSLQYLNPGQTVCMVNHLNTNKPPLGFELDDRYYILVQYFLLIRGRIHLKELRINDQGAYEIWATGRIASCDYAGMIFGYGYYALAAAVPIGGLLFCCWEGCFLEEKTSSDTNSNKSS